jgi:hypothetical protein
VNFVWCELAELNDGPPDVRYLLAFRKEGRSQKHIKADLPACASDSLANVAKRAALVEAECTNGIVGTLDTDSHNALLIIAQLRAEDREPVRIHEFGAGLDDDLTQVRQVPRPTKHPLQNVFRAFVRI